ncbi:hypothetical protein Tco_1063353 [Tanacetum coccineum]
MVLSDNQIGCPNNVLDRKMLENSSNDSREELYLNDEEDDGDSMVVPQTPKIINSIKDLREENRDIFSTINEAIKLMIAIATNMSCVIENNIRKEGLKDNLKKLNTLKEVDINKDCKPSQMTKLEHGMEKTVQNQGQVQMPKSESNINGISSNRSRN